MPRIIYNNEQPSYYDSGGYNNPRYNGGYILLTLVILLILFFWADLSRLRNNFDYWISGNPNSTTLPVEGPITRNNTEIRYVAADNLNLREEPSNLARASYILPRGTKVALLGGSHQEPDGKVWLKVKADSFTGTQVGWVRQLWLGPNQNTVIIAPVNGSITVPIAEIRYITADNLKLREEPNSLARTNYYLPRRTKITLLGNRHQGSNGDVWFKVRVGTSDGTRVGWVRQQYFE